MHCILSAYFKIKTNLTFCSALYVNLLCVK
uniref:Uncharacterized protein n=1 Tax=Anguilla anguilla TaxID=7936 RepID=A0A0E9PVK2_ANGAN